MNAKRHTHNETTKTMNTETKKINALYERCLDLPDDFDPTHVYPLNEQRHVRTYRAAVELARDLCVLTDDDDLARTLRLFFQNELNQHNVIDDIECSNYDLTPTRITRPFTEAN